MNDAYSRKRSAKARLIESGRKRADAGFAPGPVWKPLNPSGKTTGDVATFGADMPMKRPAYVFLASPQCSGYIAGEVLPVADGS